MRKRWLFVPLIIGILAIGVVTAGATLAQVGRHDGNSRIGNFAVRVADILGLEESQVKDAFQQVQSDITAENLEAKMAVLVEQGTLTQDEVDEIIAWYDARPVDIPGFGLMGKRGRGYGGFGTGAGVEDKLDAAVEQGSLTQVQADELQDWYDVRPASLDELTHDGTMRGRGMRGKFQGRFGGGHRFDGMGFGERNPGIVR